MPYWSHFPWACSPVSPPTPITGSPSPSQSQPEPKLVRAGYQPQSKPSRKPRDASPPRSFQGNPCRLSPQAGGEPSRVYPDEALERTSAGPDNPWTWTLVPVLFLIFLWKEKADSHLFAPVLEGGLEFELNCFGGSRREQI